MNIDPIKVKVLLAKRDQNTKEFCKHNSLSYSTVSALLQRKRAGNIKTIGKLAKALNVSVTEILED